MASSPEAAIDILQAPTNDLEAGNGVLGAVVLTATGVKLQQEESRNGVDLSSFPGRPPGLHPLAIPPLTTSQRLYIVLPQMVGAAILDGGMNFGIACAMYLNAKNVQLWVLKNNTVAGDLAVTIFIQGILTFCIASGLVHVDLRNHRVKAFPYPWPDTAWGAARRRAPEDAQTHLGRIWTRFHNDQGLARGLHFFSGSDVNDIFDTRLTRPQFCKRLAWSVWKGSVLSLMYFFLLWPISIAIITPIWNEVNLGNGNFTVPIIKGIYGAVYGLLMNPVCAMIAMGSEDSVRHHRSQLQRDRFEHPEKEAMKTTAAERVVNNILPEETGPNGALPTQILHPLVQVSDNQPRRVESLRRSLHTLDNSGRGAKSTSESDESMDSPGTEPGPPGTSRPSTDMQRSRSYNMSRRPSQKRYPLVSTNGGMCRSISAGGYLARPRGGNSCGSSLAQNPPIAEETTLPPIPGLP